jgi:hypothetical protein
MTINYLYSLTFSNGKQYIGLSVNPKKRLRGHCVDAKKGIRTAPIYAAIRKYGPPSVSVLCCGSSDYIADLEIRSIAAFHTSNRAFGYNVHLGGSLGPTPETSAKVGAAHRGKKLSPEQLAILRAAHLGKPAWNKGKPASPEAKAKMRASREGRTLSPEHRAKIAAAQLGRKLPPERRAKAITSLVKARAVIGPEALAKMSAARMGYTPWNKGKKASAEARAAMSAARKGRIPWNKGAGKAREFPAGNGGLTDEPRGGL